MPSGSTRSPATSRPRLFKCRSTPTGTLPTDDDLDNAVTRGFVTTNMPSWNPLTPQQRADLVAYIKTFSPRWKTEKAGNSDPHSAGNSRDHSKAFFTGASCFRRWNVGNATGRRDTATARRPPTLTDSKDNPIRPYNFSTGSRFKCGETNQDLYRIFMTGVDGTPMPSFADVTSSPTMRGTWCISCELCRRCTHPELAAGKNMLQSMRRISSRSARAAKQAATNSLLGRA